MKRLLRHTILLWVALTVGVLSGWGMSTVEPTNDTLVEESPAEQEEAKLDVVGLIFEHIGDSYSWHITTINGHHIEIPLLCIVRSQEGRWYAFSSAKVAHEHTYKGFFINHEGEQWKGKLVARNSEGELYRPLDLSITKNAAGVMFNSLVVIIIILGVAGWYRKRNYDTNAIPRGFVGAVEMLIMSVEDDVIKPSVGKDYKRYSPYLLTAFFFIFVSNLLGLVPIFPGGANVTGNIAVTLVLALATMFAVNVFGNKEYWKEILWPDVPVWMKVPIPLMPVIELFGIISKPFALTIRLFANIMAGHTVLIALTCLVFITVNMGATMNGVMTVFSVLLSVFMLVLEVLVAYIQAYVFTMLSAVFIGLSRKEHHAVHKK